MNLKIIFGEKDLKKEYIVNNFYYEDNIHYKLKKRIDEFENNTIITDIYNFTYDAYENPNTNTFIINDSIKNKDLEILKEIIKKKKIYIDSIEIYYFKDIDTLEYPNTNILNEVCYYVNIKEGNLPGKEYLDYKNKEYLKGHYIISEEHTYKELTLDYNENLELDLLDIDDFHFTELQDFLLENFKEISIEEYFKIEKKVKKAFMRESSFYKTRQSFFFLIDLNDILNIINLKRE